MKTSPLFIFRFLVPVAACVTLASAHGAVVIGDNFTLNSTDRTAGTSINGLTTEIGDATWIGSNWQLAGDSSNGYIKSVANTNSAVGTAFSPSSYASDGSLLTISVDVAFRTSSGYFDITFARASSNLSTNGLLYMAVNPNGDAWSVRGYGGTVLASGALSDVITAYDTSTRYSYTLSYDMTLQKVSATINGQTVMSNISYEVTSTITNTFVWTQFPGTTAEIDNYQVSVVPELTAATLVPLGIAVLGAGLAGKFRKVR